MGGGGHRIIQSSIDEIVSRWLLLPPSPHLPGLFHKAHGKSTVRAGAEQQTVISNLYVLLHVCAAMGVGCSRRAGWAKRGTGRVGQPLLKCSKWP